MGERHASTLEWRQIARGPRPLYHVLTWPDIEDWTPEDFYAVGESDWEDFHSHWRHYAGELSGSCLEIGCGAGRISRMLGQQFDEVHSLDVSADMIEKARAAAPDNVQFHQVDGVRVPLPDESVDHVFSVHVLQHLDDFEDVSTYVSEAERVLRPGGTMMLHIAISSNNDKLLGRRGVIRRELKLWRARRGLARGREHHAVRYREYRWEDVQRLLMSLRLERVELRLIPVRSNGYGHSFWLATKPGRLARLQRLDPDQLADPVGRADARGIEPPSVVKPEIPVAVRPLGASRPGAAEHDRDRPGQLGQLRSQLVD